MRARYGVMLDGADKDQATKRQQANVVGGFRMGVPYGASGSDAMTNNREPEVVREEGRSERPWSSWSRAELKARRTALGEGWAIRACAND